MWTNQVPTQLQEPFFFVNKKNKSETNLSNAAQIFCTSTRKVPFGRSSNAGALKAATSGFLVTKTTEAHQ